MSDEIVGQWWSKSDGPVGALPDTPLNEIMRWVLEQIHRGNVMREAGTSGELYTLVVGHRAAPECTAAEWVSHERNRSLALMVAKTFADARESGFTPALRDTSEELRFVADDNGIMNTELHYALELMDILGRIRTRTFELITLPLVEKASRDLVLLIREATRCHLFGLDKACAALCRAALEKALSERVPADELNAQRARRRDSGDLECMIDAAGKTLLDARLVGFAHTVRIKGNEVMHGRSADEAADSFLLLTDTRLLIERLFAHG